MSRPSKKRRELTDALNAAMREASGLGVLFSQEVARRLGIASTDLECLDYLGRGPLTAGALAGLTGLTTGAITGVVDRLERAGLARRKRDAEDRRKVLVEATEAAAGRVPPFFEPMERRAMAALAPYGEAELALLLDFMRRARDAASAAMAELQAMPEPEAPADARRRLRG
jgi:DNA-binding MarR family transcriptional regulator